MTTGTRVSYLFSIFFLFLLGISPFMIYSTDFMDSSIGVFFISCDVLDSFSFFVFFYFNQSRLNQVYTFASTRTCFGPATIKLAYPYSSTEHSANNYIPLSLWNFTLLTLTFQMNNHKVSYKPTPSLNPLEYAPRKYSLRNMPPPLI